MNIRRWWRSKPISQPRQKPRPTGAEQAIARETLLSAFQHCHDVHRETFRLGGDPPVEGLLLYARGMVDLKRLNDEVWPQLNRLVSASARNRFDPALLLRHWPYTTLTPLSNMEEVVDKLFMGQLILHFDATRFTLAVDIAQRPQRQPEDTTTEISIRGPRDGLIEDLDVNVALIRKRLRTAILHHEQYVLGQRSKTRVALLYMADIVPPAVIQQIKARLEQIQVDGLFSSNQLEELLTDSPYRLFPLFHYSGRPDFVADALVRGRFALLMDGVPTALIAPAQLLLIMKNAEDAEYAWAYNSMERLLRLAAMSIAVFLPGFWVALTTYHQDQLPLILLGNIAQAREGVPLPSPLEALVLTFLFELFREAGLRLPLAIGQVLAVVGGIIIGEAAIRAGLTNPSLVVIIASSAVATFTLSNQSLAGTVSILRYFNLIFSALLGLFGFLGSAFLILIYVCHLRSFGIPYMAPLAPVRWPDFIQAAIHPSPQKLKHRPDLLDPGDPDRKR
ncbi:GerA spore germination protein [Caldalkalibacillus thermarum TA2.A1]|uniref:GerA spore germination protein n=1 Tax=Caldalkalibacillus thermarum (strain TA2.A1) TaxID=986075 RepID=F5L4L6_CALTT|nr:spore germination protein [Caldalkalibacillus thermarum]EGL83710.1 GerA spore germination protein [Caldalkalibacillus thermarum TA2.A1]